MGLGLMTGSTKCAARGLNESLNALLGRPHCLREGILELVDPIGMEVHVRHGLARY